MATRLLLALVLALHSALGWGAMLQGAHAGVSGPSTALVDPCGDSCCCPPSHCPCVIEVPVPGSSEPAPAIPSQRGEQDGPRFASPRPDTVTSSPVVADETPAHAWASLCLRPAGDHSRRVMQLQCVWRN